MKLLGWMHRKFRQNNSDPTKDFVIGQPSVHDQQHYPKPNFKPFKQNPRSSFTGLGSAEVDDGSGSYEEDASFSVSDIFHGFLAIGTLGSDQVLGDPITPKFSISVENITEKETDVTENELKLFNDELEKVLAAETKDDGYNYDSSSRNSHVSNGRSSHGSTITLAGKPIEARESNVSGTTLCPLQGYLFGSAIELSETSKVAKKEHRTSLGELFQRSKLAEENAKCDKEERRAEREVDKSAIHLMKKLLKRKMLHASSRTSTATGGGLVDSASAENKLHKILHMFHRKVYPDNSTTSRKSDKPEKYDKKKKTNRDHGGDSNEDQTLPDEDIIIYPQRAIQKLRMRRYKSRCNPSYFTLPIGDPNAGPEQWIKTDPDYLVLEL